MGFGTSSVIQWLRLCVPNAEGPSSIPRQGARSRMLQLRPGTVENKQTKDHAYLKKKFDVLLSSLSRVFKLVFKYTLFLFFTFLLVYVMFMQTMIRTSTNINRSGSPDN